MGPKLCKKTGIRICLNRKALCFRVNYMYAAIIPRVNEVTSDVSLITMHCV